MSRSRGSDATRRGRQRTRRQLRRRGLVVAEGSDTEVEYVDALKQLVRESHTDSVGVKVVGVGRDPVSVLNKARELLKDARRDGEPYDWCCVVVDVDEHAHLDDCIRLGAENDINVIVSNPSFEVWLLWHLQDTRRHCTQDDLVALLRRHGHGGKHLKATFPLANYPDAITRAYTADPALETRRHGPNPSSAMPVLLRLMGAP